MGEISIAFLCYFWLHFPTHFCIVACLGTETKEAVKGLELGGKGEKGHSYTVLKELKLQ